MSRRTGRESLTGAARILAAAAVVLLFFSTLVAATAQQSILATLGAFGGERTPGYSEALERWRALRAADKVAAGERETVQRLKREILTGGFALERGRRAEESLRVEAASVVADLEQTRCATSATSPMSLAELDALMTRTERCLLRNPPATAEAAQVADARVNLAQATQAVERTRQDLAGREKELAELEAGLARAEDGADGSGPALRAAFQDYAFVEKVAVLAWLVSAPPFLTQLLLITVSGAFGAVLVLLIVIVYPDNQMKLTRGEGYFARIALGAIVAIALYVILTSGVAVIQGAPALAGGTNAMAFALVGLIAGAFANNVARWISERADTFLGLKEEPKRPGGADGR
jgi:hypothetical protein